MVSFVLVTRILGSDRAHVLPGGDWCAGAVTALLGTHFTVYVPPALVPPVRGGRLEVDTSVLNGFPDSQHFDRVHSSPGAGSAALLRCGVVCPRSGSFRVLSAYAEVLQPLHPYYCSCPDGATVQVPALDLGLVV